MVTTQLLFTVYFMTAIFYSAWLIAGTVNIIRLYDETVIIYSVLKWFLFFTVWLIAGTVNIICLYNEIVIIYSVLKWFLFFTVWLIAGTVNIIRLYNETVIIYSVLLKLFLFLTVWLIARTGCTTTQLSFTVYWNGFYFLQCGLLLERSTSSACTMKQLLFIV